LPFALALRNPAFTRSTIRLRSNSATAPRTVKTILPAGVLVSSCSEKRHELDALGSERFQRSKQVAHRSGEAIELPDHDSIKAPAVRVSHQAVKFRACLLGSADADVHILGRDPPAAALGIFAKLTGLHRRVLAIVGGAHPRIDSDSHAFPFCISAVDVRTNRLGLPFYFPSAIKLARILV
jgi:hypothetical protein